MVLIAVLAALLAGHRTQLPRVESSPPPATVSSSQSSTRMALSSFCRIDICVDYASPWGRRVPVVYIVPGEVLTVRLGFAPTSVAATLLTALNRRGRAQVLRPGRVLAWRVPGPGVLLVSATGSGGDVSYVVRLTGIVR